MGQCFSFQKKKKKKKNNNNKVAPLGDSLVTLKGEKVVPNGTSTSSLVSCAGERLLNVSLQVSLHRLATVIASSSESGCSAQSETSGMSSRYLLHGIRPKQSTV